MGYAAFPGTISDRNGGIYPAQGYYRPLVDTPDSKVHWSNMGTIWGRQHPGEPHVGPVNFAIWDITCEIQILNKSMVENWGTTLL